MANNSMLEAARTLVTLGYSPIPLHGIANGYCTCYKSDNCCPSPGKHPIGVGWLGHTMELRDLVDRFEEHPEYNIGIVTTGLVVLDVDRHDGDVDGLKTLMELEYKHESLNTQWVSTGSGGYHFYFRKPEDRVVKNRNRHSGLDLRTDGGLVVAPPSMHISGAAYIWGAGPWYVDDLPLPPDWLLDYFDHNKQKKANRIELEDCPSTRVPEERFAELMDSFAFRTLWDHVSSSRDNSDSGFDFRIACFAVKKGWTADEIQPLLRAHREVWNSKYKGVEYYATTIGNAIAWIGGNE